MDALDAAALSGEIFKLTHYPAARSVESSRRARYTGRTRA